MHGWWFGWWLLLIFHGGGISAMDGSVVKEWRWFGGDAAPGIHVLATFSFFSFLPSCINRVKDSLRNDQRYESVKHADREVFFNEYLSELKAAEEEAERDARGKREAGGCTYLGNGFLSHSLL
ncbi:unnamed protein product [Dovyalis caffra]|uniref:Uncharacterized protein n=1 Tax=Dovyalis caffra TaxID=77055 RepID=A0AAV1SGG6_9ROSI|nr:unnamed protein product [Dovyalis caffra]